MTQGTIETKGTRLYFALSEAAIHKVACPTGISGLSAPASNISTTCLDSERSEGRGGMKEWAPIQVTINYIPRSAAHQALEALNESREVIPWLEMLSDTNPEDVPEDIDSEGYLVSPGPTTNGFMGYVVDFQTEKGLNEIVRGTLTIQPSGPLMRDRFAPSLP